MDKINALLHFVAMNAIAIGWSFAAYAFLAAFVNKKLWPKPSGPAVLVVLHFVLIDWPAAQASAGASAQGIVLHFFGVEIPVPLMSWSKLLQGPPKSTGSTLAASARALLPLAFLALTLPGCAALPLNHVQRCDVLHQRAVGWKAGAIVAGGLSATGIVSALVVTGVTALRVGGISALTLGGAMSLSTFMAVDGEHVYATQCEGPQPSPAPVM